MCEECVSTYYAKLPAISATIVVIPPRAIIMITTTIAIRMYTQKNERAKLLRGILLELSAKITIKIKPITGIEKRMLYPKYAQAVKGRYFGGKATISCFSISVINFSYQCVKIKTHVLYDYNTTKHVVNL